MKRGGLCVSVCVSVDHNRQPYKTADWSVFLDVDSCGSKMGPRSRKANGHFLRAILGQTYLPAVDILNIIR